MTTIIKHYIGITHPISGENISKKEHDIILEAWKHSNCPQGIHLWDECWSTSPCDGEIEHCLHCDACEMEVHIEKIIIPDGKNKIINGNLK